MTYRQNMSWIEDGYGKVTVRFVVSNTFEGLQATDTLSTEANIFEINSITKKAANKNGGFIQNTLEFNITQSKVHTTVEKDCLTFVKNAIVPTVRRYVGVFINPSGNDGEPDISNHEDMFMGLIQNAFESEDFLWTLTASDENPSGFYETTVNALSDWKIDAKPYNDSVLSEIKLSQLIYGDEANDIPGIDSTWETGYVGEAPGYYSHDDFTVKTDRVVNLNRLLLKLIDNFRLALENKGFGTYDIILDKCELDGKWHPARWFHSTVPVDNGEVQDENTRYTGQVFSPDPNRPSFYFYKQYPMFYPDDYTKLEINGTETMTDAKSPWISYRMVKYPPSFLPEGLEGLEPTYTTESNYRLDRLANIFSLFDEIAENFGIFYQLYWETSTELHVKFTSRQDFIQDTVFFKTAIKSSTKYSAGDITSKYYYGEAGNYCQDEGWNTYGSKMEDGLSFTYQNTELQRDQTDKKRISFTISPLVKLVNRMVDNAVGTGDDLMTTRIIEGGYRPLGIPHGHIFCNDGTDQLAYGENAFGIHTGIYLYVPYYLDHPPVNNEPSAYWTPAIALTMNIRGTDKSYFKLSDYLNDIVEGDVKYYQAEINLECPCIMGFLPEDPNNTGYPDFTEIPNWNNCDVGKLIIKDGVHYTVTEVKWLVKEKKTSMVCHNAERFDITDITTTEFSMTENSDKYLKPSLTADSATVKTNSSDLLAGFLTDKIVADDNIDIDLVDVNGVKNLAVKGLGKVKVDATDAASGYLWDKVTSLSLTLTSIDVGAGVKKLNIEGGAGSLPAGTENQTVRYNSSNELVATDIIELTEFETHPFAKYLDCNYGVRIQNTQPNPSLEIMPQSPGTGGIDLYDYVADPSNDPQILRFRSYADDGEGNGGTKIFNAVGGINPALQIYKDQSNVALEVDKDGKTIIREGLNIHTANVGSGKFLKDTDGSGNVDWDYPRKYKKTEITRAMLLDLDSNPVNITAGLGSSPKIVIMHNIFLIAESATFDYSGFIKFTDLVDTDYIFTFDLSRFVGYGQTVQISWDYYAGQANVLMMTDNAWYLKEYSAITDDNGNSGSLWVIVEYEEIGSF